MNCLVIGGAGFIGRHLSAALVAAGHRVCGFDLPPAGGEARWPAIDGVTWMGGDFTDPESMAAALAGVDIVFHLVSATIPKTSNDNPHSDLQLNVAATLRLLDRIVTSDQPPRLVFISSGGTVYGIPRTIPIAEDHPTEPLCAYGVGKLAIEKYLALYRHLHGLDYRILRLANPYGEEQPLGRGQGVIPVFLSTALRQQPLEIWGDGTVVRDYLYIGDLCSALLSVMDYHGPERIFNVGGGSGHSLIDLIGIIRHLLGHDIDCRFLPARACDVPVNVLDIHRAKNHLDWQPTTPLVEGMAAVLSWLRSR